MQTIMFSTLPQSTTPEELILWHANATKQPNKPFEIITSHTAPTLEEAKQELYDLHNDGAILLQSAEPQELQPTGVMTNLQERLERLQTLRESVHTEALPRNRASARTTCKKCESMLSNKYLEDRDMCPVCGNTLLSPTVTARLENLDERIEKCKTELEEATNRLMEREAPTTWVVMATNE